MTVTTPGRCLAALVSTPRSTPWLTGLRTTWA